jgi:hypothetical protein
VRNDGPVDLRALSLQLSPSGAPFRVTSCSPSLLRGQSCSARVNFAANSPGQSSATLSAYEGGTRLASTQLYGAGNNQAPPTSAGTVQSFVDNASLNGNAGQGSGSNTGTSGGNAPTGNGPKGNVPKSMMPGAKIGLKAGTQTYTPGFQALAPNRTVNNPQKQPLAASPIPADNRKVRRPPPKASSPPAVH